MTQYVVTAPCLVHVPFDTPQGKQLGTLYTGAVLPDSVPRDRIEFWLDGGMIEKVGAEPASTPDPSAPPEPSGPATPPGLQAPPESGPGSSKDAWVDYAVQRGMDRAEADALNKADLIKRLKGETSGQPGE
jgi:hypothetical protein